MVKISGRFIDLGPERGDGGGEIVAMGMPEELAKAKRSSTGAFSAPVLGRGGKKNRVEAAE